MAKSRPPPSQRRSHGSLPLFPNSKAMQPPPAPPVMSQANPNPMPPTPSNPASATMPVSSSSPSTYAGVGPLPPSYENTQLPSMKKGGWVKETGIYKLHEGEKVIPARDGYHKKS